MKIPSSVKIGGNIFDIVYTDNFDLGKVNVNGEISYQKRQIRLAPDLNEQEQQITFVHELIHGILQFMGEKELNDDEQMVEKIAQIINMFLVDNPNIFEKECNCKCKEKQKQDLVKDNAINDISFKRQVENEDFYVIRVGEDGELVIKTISEIFSPYCDGCYKSNNYFLSRKHTQEAIDKINLILLSQKQLEALDLNK